MVYLYVVTVTCLCVLLFSHFIPARTLVTDLMPDMSMSNFTSEVINLTFICTIDPDSVAKYCEVMAMSDNGDNITSTVMRAQYS